MNEWEKKQTRQREATETANVERSFHCEEEEEDNRYASQ